MRLLQRFTVVAAALALWTASSGANVAAAQTRAQLGAVDRYVRNELRRQRIPGLSIAILKGDKVLLARGYGLANVEHRVPATDSTVYQSGSVGKMFTAALVLQLADSGRLDLDAPIRRYLTEGPVRWDSVTVRHLLTHTSGIPDYTDSVVDLRRDYSEEDLVRVAAALPPLFAPGERWSYSNTGYVLLGAIVRRGGGRFYGDLLRERIFAPLGMRTARIISEADIVPNRAEGYRLAGDTLKHQEWVSPTLNTTADGSLYLTVHDLARWAADLRVHRVLSEQDLATIWTPVRLNDGGTYPYGFGWMLGDVRGHRRVGHTGAWQGFKTSIERFPQSDLTVIVLANLAEARPDAISLGVAGILEPSLVPPHRLAARLPGPLPPEPVDTVLARLSADTDSGALTPSLRRFLSAPDRQEWAGLASHVASWTPLGCDRVAGPPIARLGASVTRVCYARGSGAEGDVVVTVLYTDAWRVADVDAYRF
jgi:D-alanyl-D-alanine carboxypeptidase